MSVDLSTQPCAGNCFLDVTLLFLQIYQLLLEKKPGLNLKKSREVEKVSWVNKEG